MICSSFACRVARNDGPWSSQARDDGRNAASGSDIENVCGIDVAAVFTGSFKQWQAGGREVEHAFDVQVENFVPSFLQNVKVSENSFKLYTEVKDQLFQENNQEEHPK
jgi:hypothetical protein